VPDRRSAKFAPAQLVAPGDQVRPGHDAEFLRPENAGEAYKIFHCGLICATGVRIAEIGEPFDLGRHVGELLKLGGGQQPISGRDLGRKRMGRVSGHGGPTQQITLDKICWTERLRRRVVLGGRM
jgi:hypothetical protein